MEMILSSTYHLPDSITHEAATRGLTELLRPCSPMVTKSFVNLQAFKPFFENDESRTKIVYEGLYQDVKELPEVAVVLACDDLRKDSTIKYFPIDKIQFCAEEYRDIIYDALDYFGEDK